MYPSWRATVMVPSTLTTEDNLLLLALLLAGCVTTPALRLFLKYLQKNVIASHCARRRVHSATDRRSALSAEQSTLVHPRVVSLALRAIHLLAICISFLKCAEGTP